MVLIWILCVMHPLNQTTSLVAGKSEHKIIYFNYWKYMMKIKIDRTCVQLKGGFSYTVKCCSYNFLLTWTTIHSIIFIISTCFPCSWIHCLTTKMTNKSLHYKIKWIPIVLEFIWSNITSFTPYFLMIIILEFRSDMKHFFLGT